MRGFLRYFSVLLVGVFTVCPTLFVAAVEPVAKPVFESVHRISADNRVRPSFRYVVPVAMQESLPFDRTTSSVPQNVNSDFDSDQISTTLTPATPTNSTLTTSTPPSPVPINPEPVINDPFQYRFPDGGGIPRNISSLPAGIQVIGILMFKNQKSSTAAIRLPRTGNQRISEIYYVREGDIIEVPSNLLPNRRTSGSRGTDGTEILFLVVEKITPQHVEVRSRSNVDDKHILR
ncbi:MAG: hypothetical protein LBF88_01540 [Planctomycetaceae bacterium]|nr:hypothetical protein [Planctomycetaceae bacterium]